MTILRCQLWVSLQMQEIKKFFKELMSDYTVIKNSFFPEKSNIRAVKLHKTFPLMHVYFGSKEASHGIELRDHNIFYFYKRCERESKKVNFKEVGDKKSENKQSDIGNPNYCLSEEVLKKIKNHYKVETLEVPTRLQATQKQINELYEKYYFSIRVGIEDKGKPTVIIAGEEHNDDASFMQNLMIYEMAREMFGLQHLLVELDPESLEIFTSGVTHNKGLLYNNVNSFSYLSYIAIEQGIPVTPVDEKEARNYFKENIGKEDIEVLTLVRDMFMSKDIAKAFPDTSMGTALVLCGAKHIPGLERFLMEEGNYNIVTFNINDYRLKAGLIGNRSSTGIVKKAMVFEQDNRELYDRVLTAKKKLAVNYGLASSPKPKDNKKNEEVEVINPEEIGQEAKKSGACISDSPKASTTALSFFPTPSPPKSGMGDSMSIATSPSIQEKVTVDHENLTTSEEQTRDGGPSPILSS